MLIGKYYHHLEAKGRLSLPKAFRQINQTWVVTRGLDGCLFLLQEDSFQREIEKIADRSLTKKANRDLVRLMTNEAAVVTADEQGRVHLPEYLINFAKLSKEVVVVGSLQYLELWDQTSYHRYIDSIEADAVTIAESIIDHA